MRKVLLIVVTLAAMMAVLAACGGGEKTEEVQPAAPAVQQEAPQQEAAQPEAAQPAAVALVGDAAKGKNTYGSLCIACHGPEAEGVQGLGKNLVTSEFVGQQTDDQLMEFIKVGRQVGDPLNSTGIAMPPKGGNPALSDQEIADLVAYLRSIHQQ
jgi:disulfide bond formation protein DsbB